MFRKRLDVPVILRSIKLQGFAAQFAGPANPDKTDASKDFSPAIAASILFKSSVFCMGPPSGRKIDWRSVPEREEVCRAGLRG